MRSIAYTIWQNDMVGLKLWLKYYSKYFDRIHLVCVATKPEYHPQLNKLQDTYNLTYEFQPVSLIDPDTAFKAINERQRRFFDSFDWVLYCNLDEFLIPDTKKYKNLKDVMKKYPLNWIACEGFDVVQAEDENPIDFSKPYLKQRRYWIKNSNYNKVLLSRVMLEWNAGFHQVKEMDPLNSTLIKDTGLYLVHLKYADMHPQLPRDFGPQVTTYHADILGRPKEDRWLIPEEVRKFI